MILKKKKKSLQQMDTLNIVSHIVWDRSDYFMCLKSNYLEDNKILHIDRCFTCVGCSCH